MPQVRYRAFAVACALLFALRRVEADPAPPGASTPRAVIVVASDGSRADKLEDLLSELLGRDGVELAFESRERFDPHEVLSPSGAGSDIRVFIDLTEPNLARLYFRAPDGERFLVRSLALDSSTDDLGREQVGQVVESSTLTLLHSQAGLSREQAASAIEAARPEPAKPLPVNTSPASKPPRGTSAPAPTPSALHGDVALRYGFESLGDAIALRHGPGIELAVAQSVLGARVTLERGFEQAIHAPDFAATEQVYSARLLGELGVRVAAHQRAAVAVGGGIDVAHLDPGPPLAVDVTASAPKTHVVPIVRAELRYELTFAPVTVAAAGFTDIACAKTHYDVIEDGNVHRVASLNTLRPGAALVVGIRFGL
jgi:hypothetical protein